MAPSLERVRAANAMQLVDTVKTKTGSGGLVSLDVKTAVLGSAGPAASRAPLAVSKNQELTLATDLRKDHRWPYDLQSHRIGHKLRREDVADAQQSMTAGAVAHLSGLGDKSGCLDAYTPLLEESTLELPAIGLCK